MMRGVRSKSMLVLALLLQGCLDPYSPPVSDNEVNILVVDGFLDTSEGSARVTLSKAVPLTATSTTLPEPNALVTLLDDSGSSHALSETTTGSYIATGIPIKSNAQYRIHIRTMTGSEYQSDLMGIYETPPIDSVTWITDNEKLTVRVNTHDFTNSTKHFRWTYEETWNYHAAVLSQYKVVGTQFVDRTPSEMVFYCWNTEPSTNINIGSTVRLSENIVSQQPVTYIPVGSQKLSMKYSILVTQRGISEEEYTYLDQLKKTTESVGGLFDPQPSQVPGNIRRMDSSSPLAIGYFGVGNTVKERIFISFTDLPRDFQVIYPMAGCNPPDTVCVLPSPIVNCTFTDRDLVEGIVLGSAIYSGISLVGITLTSLQCADCRYQGGVLTKPEFWQ